jgi:hypothetical protein
MFNIPGDKSFMAVGILVVEVNVTKPNSLIGD